MGSRVRVQDASLDLRGAFLPLRRALRCRAESGAILRDEQRVCAFLGIDGISETVLMNS